MIIIISFTIDYGTTHTHPTVLMRFSNAFCALLATMCR